MSPSELINYLNVIVKNQMNICIMIWGAPGIGKSSIVAQVAKTLGLQLIDLRLSQLAPTDIRGLPIVDDGVSRWCPPEFLPKDGKGILFLDEINMAPPTLQGVAQQLILDRRVGNYEVPKDWFIWAAGNRKEDRASVFEMPAPLANRFVHLEIEPEFDSFKAWGLMNGLHEQILAFLSYRKNLLHKIDSSNPNWPSPRSWHVASKLHEAGLDIEPSVGKGPATEFLAFVALYDNMPDVELILKNQKPQPDFPNEPSIRYALVVALLTRISNCEETLNALIYLAEYAPAEWVQLFAVDAIPIIRKAGKLPDLSKLIRSEPALKDFITNFRQLIGAI